MHKQHAIVNFARVKEHDLPDQAQTIIDKMTNNAYFPRPVPALTTIQKGKTEFADALLKSTEAPSKEQTAIKNQKKVILVNSLTQLGNYVNAVADGDVAKIDSSGFQISKEPTPVGILDAPKFINVTYGQNSGEANIEIAKVEKATDYMLLYMPFPGSSDNNEWFGKVTSKTKFTLSGLESGKKYVFKAAAISSAANDKNKYNFSDTIEKLIP